MGKCQTGRSMEVTEGHGRSLAQPAGLRKALEGGSPSQEGQVWQVEEEASGRVSTQGAQETQSFGHAGKRSKTCTCTPCQGGHLHGRHGEVLGWVSALLPPPPITDHQTQSIASFSLNLGLRRCHTGATAAPGLSRTQRNPQSPSRRGSYSQRQ